MLITLTADQLRQAASIRDQIEALETELTAILQGTAAPVSGSASTPTGKKRGSKPGKRIMSPETKAKMTEAQRRRWAAVRGDK